VRYGAAASLTTSSFAGIALSLASVKAGSNTFGYLILEQLDFKRI